MVQVDEATNIVRDAGGRVVGRTRLQKLAFLLEASGLGSGFSFSYRRFGPYSDELYTSARDAQLLGLLREEEVETGWGGTYSIFTADQIPRDNVPATRKELAQLAAKADPIELELAATAVFLYMQGLRDGWAEVAKRKPDKSKDGRLIKAKPLYERMRKINTPVPLPEVC